MFSILRPGKSKGHEYVVDEIKVENGRMTWKDKKVTKREWERQS